MQPPPVRDPMEVEAHRIEHLAARGALTGTGAADWSAAASDLGAELPTLRRAPKETAASGYDAKAEAQTPGPATAAPVDTTTAARAPAGLLTEDDAAPTKGQMRKSDFLEALRSEICASVDAALAGTGRDSQGCPWIDHWLDYYGGRSASQVEAALQRYAPETRGAGNASAYVRLVSARVGRSAQTWARTGELTDIPSEVPDSPMAGGGVLGAFGGMFFKARPGGPRQVPDAGSVKDALGAGRTLPTDVRTRMEPAFGTSFSHVRVHTDAAGSRLSDSLSARAFTVGEHVAFGSGEYRPGTLAGDALIAHELAHVVQQSGGAESLAKAADTNALERDADRAAEAAVRSTLDPAQSRPGTQRRTGLRLQRCSKDGASKSATKDPKLLQDFAAKFSAAADLIRKNPEGMKLVVEAEAAGAGFGGYSEDGPKADTWPYTSGHNVYIPRAHTDAVIAMSDFLFELNNAIRAPQIADIQKEAAKGSAGTLTARDYARKIVEQEVEGMLRLGEIWFEGRKTLRGHEWDKYDGDFYLSEYKQFRAGTKTKVDIVNDVLGRTYTSGVDRGKTTEQYYMDQYTSVSGGR